MQTQKLLFLIYNESKPSADYANRSGEKYNNTGYVLINVALRRVRVTQVFPNCAPQRDWKEK
jgi:hypothetical protein